MSPRPSKHEGTAPDEESKTTGGVTLSEEDEMLPKDAQPTYEPSREGNVPDTAGKHGKMAPEAAKGLDEAAEEKG